VKYEVHYCKRTSSSLVNFLGKAECNLARAYLFHNSKTYLLV